MKPPAFFLKTPDVSPRWKPTQYLFFPSDLSQQCSSDNQIVRTANFHSTAQHGGIFSLVSGRQVGHFSAPFLKLLVRMEAVIKQYQKRGLWAMLFTQSKPQHEFSPTHPITFFRSYGSTWFKAGTWKESGQDKWKEGSKWKMQRTVLPQTGPETLHLLRQSNMLVILFGSHLDSAVTKVVANW